MTEDLFLLLARPFFHLLPHTLGYTFDVLGADLNTGIDLQILAPLLERRLAPGPRHHPPKPWRTRRVDNIEFLVARIPRRVTGGTLVHRPPVRNLAQDCHEQLVSQSVAFHASSAGA